MKNDAKILQAIKEAEQEIQIAESKEKQGSMLFTSSASLLERAPSPRQIQESLDTSTGGSAMPDTPEFDLDEINQRFQQLKEFNSRLLEFVTKFQANEKLFS